MTGLFFLPRSGQPGLMRGLGWCVFGPINRRWAR